MKNINTFIKENVNKIGKWVYVYPEIPEKKLNNAIKAFKCEDFYESILAIYDDTIFGKADEGLVFTGEKFIFKEDFEEPLVFKYADIKHAEHVKEVKIGKFGRKKTDEYTLIVLKDGTKYKLSKPMLDFNHKEFANFLNQIVTQFDDYKEEKQIKSISEMPEELKLAYLKIIINMTYLDDEYIDERELAELLLLMTRLEVDRDTRFALRSYIANLSHENMEPIEKLLKIIKQNSDASHHKLIIISLAKDLINVFFSSKNTITRDFDFLNKHKDLFGLNDEEIDLAYQAIENDHKILKHDIDDKSIQKQAKELAAKAVAAGVPLAAVYLSGSVVGLSAAGITSGLAALGLGMGMTGGLVAVGMIGLLSYQGVKYLTGVNERDKYKQKELMLHEVIKQTQKTISLVIDDLNYIVKKLNETIIKHHQQKEKIQKLVSIIAQYQGALKSLDKKSDMVQNVIIRTKCPKILDEDRLKSLTSEPTKKPLYDYIIKNYEIKEISKNGKKIKHFVLKEDVETEVLEEMSKIFETIGYFELGSAVKSTVASKITEVTKRFKNE